MQDPDYIPDAFGAPPQMPDMGNGTGGGSMLPPNVDDIVIKNHFPVARIKRIMQADDDVGKVAQVTPVVVCKSRRVASRETSHMRLPAIANPPHSESP
jgi:hypothetical protein